MPITSSCVEAERDSPAVELRSRAEILPAKDGRSVMTHHVRHTGTEYLPVLILSQNKVLPTECSLKH